MPETTVDRTLAPPARLLTGPGPSNVDPRVTAALGGPLVGHLDPFFLQLMTDTMHDLRVVYRTAHHHTIPMSGTGTAGLETIMLNLLEPGDEVIVGVIGFFGTRLAETARRAGATVRVIEAPLGEIIAPERFEEELRRKPAKLVALVHAETSTGAWQPVEPVAEIAHRHGAMIAIDCVTSLGGIPLEIDAWDIDAAGSCSQKCIGAPPGLSPVTFGPRAMEAIHARRGKPSTLYFDLSMLFQYWGEDGTRRDRVFHHTAPIASMYALREALRLVLEEGLEARWERHRTVSRLLTQGLEQLGLELFTPVAHRLPQLTVVTIPTGVDDRRVRSRLLEMGIEIGSGFAALSGKAWRIGLMGYNAREETVDRVLGALEEVLKQEGWRG
jgi:alanine-glyoxylate transaminase/serine-glyoxylate transaminase/serine-pyruvate transaminase